MLKKIKFYFILNCLSFTIMTFALNLFYITSGIVDEINKLGYVQLTLQYLSVTTVISLLFFAFDKLIKKDEIYSHLISLLIVMASVYGLGGGVYKWFPIFSWDTPITLGIILIIYFAVYFLLFAKNIEASNQINKKLKEMQEAEQNEENH